MKKICLYGLILCSFGSMMLASCGGGNTSSSTPGSSSPVTPASSSGAGDSSSASTSSEEPLQPTESLTDAMIAPFKEGYSTQSINHTAYDGEESSPSYYDVQVSEGNIGIQIYNSTPFEEQGIKDVYHDYHYEPMAQQDGDETYYLVADCGLGIDNTIKYSFLEVQDPLTLEDTNAYWDDMYYDNFFPGLDASMFTKVDDNHFSLDLTKVQDDDLKRLETQLHFDNYGNSLCGVESFVLVTSADSIIGYELDLEQYSSSGTYVKKSAEGKFLDSGADCISEVTPLVGEEDADFKAAMAKLAKHNYEFVQKQASYSVEGGSMQNTLHYEGKADGDSTVYYSYDVNSGKKNFAYAYKNTVQEGKTYLGGYVPLGDKFIPDSVVYIGNIDEYLPSFGNISSLYFVKDASSTSDKLIYTLNKDIRISTINAIDLFTPYDYDQYPDRLVNLTITIEGDKVTFVNRTSDDEDSGLYLELVYSNIGNVSEFMSDNDILESAAGYTWSQLLQNIETSLSSVINIFTKEVLDSVPTIGDAYGCVSVDITDGASKPILYCATYSEETNAELEASYCQRLEDAGFTKTIVASSSQDGEDSYYYTLPVTIKNKNYKLKVEVETFWNSIQDWGQFLIHLSIVSASSK